MKSFVVVSMIIEYRNRLHEGSLRIETDYLKMEYSDQVIQMWEPQEEDRGLSPCDEVRWAFKAQGTVPLGSWLHCVNEYSHLFANEV